MILSRTRARFFVFYKYCCLDVLIPVFRVLYPRVSRRAYLRFRSVFRFSNVPDPILPILPHYTKSKQRIFSVILCAKWVTERCVRDQECGYVP